MASSGQWRRPMRSGPCGRALRYCCGSNRGRGLRPATHCVRSPTRPGPRSPSRPSPRPAKPATFRRRAPARRSSAPSNWQTSSQRGPNAWPNRTPCLDEPVRPERSAISRILRCRGDLRGGRSEALHRRCRRGFPPSLPLGDPYQIAWLRGGTPEAARIAVLALIDRGLLAVNGDNLVNSGSGQSFVREPIERAILSRCAQSGTAATAVLDDPAVEHACASYKAQLEQQQLMPDAGMGARRVGWFALAAALLLGIAAIKIAIAIGRGRYNVGFLITL